MSLCDWEADLGATSDRRVNANVSTEHTFAPVSPADSGDAGAVCRVGHMNERERIGRGKPEFQPGQRRSGSVRGHVSSQLWRDRKKWLLNHWGVFERVSRKLGTVSASYVGMVYWGDRRSAAVTQEFASLGAPGFAANSRKR